MNVIATATLVIALAALWSIRQTWRIPFERAAAIGVAFMCAELILMTGPLSDWLSPRLHALTDVWNLEDLIAHILYMFGLFSIMYLVADHCDMTPRQFRWFIRNRLELPSTLIYGVMIAVFLAGDIGDSDASDVVATNHTPWLRAYWLVMIAAVAYIIVYTGRMLLILRQDARSKRAATAYLVALGISAVCCVAFIIGIAWLQWVLVRCEVIGYAVAASYSWRTKVAYLRNS
ncbi:hypothetical protein [Mycobacterium sp. MUNTM1]